jgi:hypothetical protein
LQHESRLFALMAVSTDHGGGFQLDQLLHPVAG